LLMQNPHTPVGRTAILDNISMDTPDCTDRSLKQHISNIRHKLQAVSGKDYIEAIYGIGFKFRTGI
ncbi:MAG: winged helix-turn-helix transcriptional regulator, partial [Lachnospiraceae bacterium]|nr:winged helix-turn-helix transcriptional regulator [Lachnospiraceae bacterium]